MGGPADIRPGQIDKIEQKQFGSIEQTEPLRILYGRSQVAGIFITPLFGFRSISVKAEGAK